MHYLVDNRLIKSENAALSYQQTNSIILKYIEDLPANIDILDYGCGKCRYSRQLNKKSRKLVLFYSEIQLSRKQMICGCYVSVREYANSHLDNAITISVEEQDNNNLSFDFILCANVISAIPFENERKVVFDNINRHLKKTGYALITVQYYNSYFKSYSDKPGSIKYNDGWIIQRGKDFSFYGIISPSKLIDYCENSGLQIMNKKLIQGSVYLLVNKEEKY